MGGLRLSVSMIRWVWTVWLLLSVTWQLLLLGVMLTVYVRTCVMLVCAVVKVLVLCVVMQWLQLWCGVKVVVTVLMLALCLCVYYLVKLDGVVGLRSTCLVGMPSSRWLAGLAQVCLSFALGVGLISVIVRFGGVCCVRRIVSVALENLVLRTVTLMCGAESICGLLVLYWGFV